MFSHVFIGINDFERCFAFYGAILPELGLQLKWVDRDKPWAGWMQPDQPRPLLVIAQPYDGAAASVGNGQMIALLAPAREHVRRVYAAALTAGGASEGEPGLRPHYHADYYGAYFRDPDGNKLAVCCHAPEPV